MKNLNVKLFVWILVVLTVLFWGQIIWCLGIKDFESALLKLPWAVSLDVLAVSIFSKWGWRLKFLQPWLVPFPNLQGTWKGTLVSTWKSPETGESPPPIEIYLSIKQSFTHFSATLFTPESSSISYASEFVLDSESGAKSINFSYTNKTKPSVRHRSNAHDGTAHLRIINEGSKALIGEYWTNRKTIGEMKLHFISKSLLEQYPPDLDKNGQ